MTAVASVQISNPGKPLFPDGLTKVDLARYYERIAEVMLPHVRGRPVHMQRYPDGIEGEEIQQKQAPDYFPDFVSRARLKRKRRGSVEHVVIDNLETLVYLAGQACITPHVWLSRTNALDNPDQLVFDLDRPAGPRDAARRGAGDARPAWRRRPRRLPVDHRVSRPARVGATGRQRRLRRGTLLRPLVGVDARRAHAQAKLVELTER
jgi:bifunctional non-homologous end joining protein LigD